jgi:hypothetical protein
MNMTRNRFRTIQNIFIAIFCVFTFSSQAIEREIIENLVDENRVLSSAIELHLTSADTPLVNSTVSLNHEDAWLFFDNIRPSDFMADHKSAVLINNEPLNVGANGRVAIYGNGTVIMPFGYGFKPLTIYSEENFDGNAKQMEIHNYHNNLGEFDNTIKSFKLKRGYMATFANGADGSGYSRVFIADEEDLEFSVMPAELYGAVSFIRVFKHEWVSKKGWCGWDAEEIRKANVTCYYDWNVGGTTTADYEYSPIRQNGGWPSWNDINEKQNVTHLLGFNEPDRPDQANMTFDQMIDIWPEMMKSGLRVGSPAWSNPWGGNGGTLFDFIDKCDELNYRVDFVALHCYWGGKSPQNWYNDLKYIHEQTGRPLWITEWNNGANWTEEWWPDASRAYTDANAKKQLDNLKGILEVLDTASFVERYFIYNWVEDCRAIVLSGELTLAGEYYAENKSAIAYNSKKEVIPQWNYQIPELEYRYFSFTNSMRVSWTDNNGELSREYILQKKVNNENFETIYSSTDVSKTFYLDPLDRKTGGKISYRLAIKTASGEMLETEEVSYFQTAGEGEIQTGNFLVNSADINTTLYPLKYSEAPLILLGIPTFNNDVPMTQRLSGISTTKFRFHFYPWSYLENSQFANPEMLASIALPAGIYNFSGLKAEVKSVSGITRNRTSVTFDQEFEQAPVVFCTIASSANFFPLTVAVRNISSTGFEMSLKSEEAIAANLTGETVNYFAIEPGKGAIDGKRITVGKNNDNTRISVNPVVIEYDSSYTKPAVFAGLLSSEDNFASTLRYSHTEASEIEISKQREFSVGESEMQSDDFGWMIMDLAAGQPDVGTGVNKKIMQKTLSFYPNPAKETLYFNFDKTTYVEIYNLTGNPVLKSNVSSFMDISSLAAGTYIIKIENELPDKLIKTK